MTVLSAVNGTQRASLAPQNLDAEAAVLGAVLLADSALPGLADEGLRPGDFSRPSHRIVYQAMLDLHAAGRAVDPVTLADHLERSGELDAVGGPVRLDALTGPVPAVGNHRHYARIVRDLSRRRAVIEAARHLSDAATGNGDLDSALAVAVDAITQQTGGAPRAVSGRDFIAKPRADVVPYVASDDGRSVLLARGTGLIIGGPSGLGKSLAAIDLAGLLTSGAGGNWLDLTVSGDTRVLMVTLEGSEEDTADRLRELVPDDALDRLVIVDRWAGNGRTPTPADLASLVRAHAVDVVLLDTLAAFLAPRWDIGRGLPEDAHEDLEAIRRLSGRHTLAWIGVAHTRKADRAGTVTDALEELSGGLHKKADAAVIIRRDGDQDGPRRRVTFAKVRRGPEPAAVIATLPERDSSEPPRLTVIAEVRARVKKEGTDAGSLAEWIAEQDGGPQAVRVILAAHPGLTDDTLRRRRPELEALGIVHGPISGMGRTHGYGTPEQWRHGRAWEALSDAA